jgi:hypothetical protein
MTQLEHPAARRSELLERWRVDIRWRAYGVISYQADGLISSRELAAAIGIDQRALIAILRLDQHFQPEIRYDIAQRRGTPWWRVNPTLKAPPKPDLPRLVDGPRNPLRVAQVSVTGS